MSNYIQERTKQGNIKMEQTWMSINGREFRDAFNRNVVLLYYLIIIMKHISSFRELGYLFDYVVFIQITRSVDQH